MATVAIHSESLDGTIRGELLERHWDGSATIRFGGSLRIRGREITIAEMIERARKDEGEVDP